MLSTTVVMLRSVIETILSANSCGGSPLKVQMMLTTGISMFGKMSIGVRTIASPPSRKIRIMSTTIVCGCLSASLTIHMIQLPNFLPGFAGRQITKLTLFPMLRGLGIQGRDKLLSGWGHSNGSGENNLPRRNLLAIDTLVVAIVRTDCGSLEGNSRKQASRP